MSFARFILSLVLCGIGGFSGALAAVFGKLALQPDTDLTQRVLCYVLLIIVSETSSVK
jgi:heme O synthase-like polyprenyltransferase